mmetsp:Transcript_14467/g.27221  ORF Transcript_14467/g.27221 Transcript_14467/m.27221 type:complete len:597 (-) Transcript_14467:102-1892(-)
MLGLRRRTARKNSSSDESFGIPTAAATNTASSTTATTTSPTNRTRITSSSASSGTSPTTHHDASSSNHHHGNRKSKQRMKRPNLTAPNKLLALSSSSLSLTQMLTKSMNHNLKDEKEDNYNSHDSINIHSKSNSNSKQVPTDVTIIRAGNEMLEWNKKYNVDDIINIQQVAAAATTDGKKDESKLHKIFIRLFFGILMVVIFLSHLYMGHVYLCGLIFFTEVMLFRELVKVRYNTFFYIIEETIPLFRTTQWLWFWTAIFYTYSDFVVEVIKGNTSLHYLLDYARFQTGFSFLLYSGTFVLTIATIQPGYIRFQLNQLCWTILVLCLTVGQLKYIMHNVYNGLFWFTLPIMLVVSNDSFAWLAGITCGRKFIQREFISISPNKTWEGFIGGWIGTMIFGWHLARFMAKYTWMICPETTFSLLPGSLECEPNHVFQPATNIFPSQIFELIPSGIAQMIPGVVDICMIDGNSMNLTACVSGEDRHTHHHFELVLKDLYPVQIHALGLSLFASFVAPFGGFLASAIKRAYGLKDFASFIPGHGGVMDRMDCQLLMALCTWVHYNTFVNMTTVSVPKMIYMYKLMKETEQEEFLKRIGEL